MKSKARERAALGAAGQDPEAVKESAYSLEDDLFSLTALRSKKQLDRVADASAPDAEELEARAEAWRQFASTDTRAMFCLLDVAAHALCRRRSLARPE